MKFISTRQGIEATSAETVFQGLAPDGGLYVPAKVEGLTVEELKGLETLGDAERVVMGALFDDLPERVREEAIARLLSRFPAEDPVPLVEKDGLRILELFHGKTGAFKDVALSMLPVYMKHAANGQRVLILTATSGDTGSAAMQGFAGVEGTEIVVFYPATGTSKIQRLQMTTPADANVHAVGIRGNFDDAQAAVKRIFASAEVNAAAAAHGITLSSANSINTGRLIPQIAYYVLAGAKLSQRDKSTNRRIDESTLPFDVVVPSGNFGNILAAYYAKKLGSPIRKLVVASNVNDVLARFVKTGVYDPGPTFTVTNSPSMDIRISSNVERLLWMLSYEAGFEDERAKALGEGERRNAAIGFACAEVSRMMADLKAKGLYELNEAAKAKLFADFDSGVATPEETEAEMRRMREAANYLIDPHTAVATFVARKLGYPKTIDGSTNRRIDESTVPVVVAATATPYKFPETCQRAFGCDVLTDPPPSFRDLETLPIAQTRICDVDRIDQEVTRLF